MTIKAIAWDLGGVLFSEGKSKAVRTLHAEHGYDEAAVLRLLNSSRANDLRKGLVEEDAFWDWARGQIPLAWDIEMIRTTWYDSYTPQPEVIALARRLHHRYRAIAFSGNIRARVERLERKHGFRGIFDIEVYSFDHGTNKDEPDFFARLVAAAGCAPDEILLVDDQDQPYARQLGIRLVRFDGSMERLKSSLLAQGVDLE